MSRIYIDPEMSEIAAAMASSDIPGIITSPISEMRALLSAISPSGGPDLGSIQDDTIGGVPVRDYRPAGAVGTIVLLHGGGWVVGSIDDYDCFARTLADRTRCRVVSVGYRLAPEHPFPAAVDDAWSVLSALDVTGPCIVLGDSAGGNLSAVVAQMARDTRSVELAGQVLIYPSVAGDAESEAMHEFVPPMMPQPDIAKYYDLYVPDVAQRTDTRFAPLLGDLQGLPAALVITASADLLADEGRRYARKLEAAGNVVTLHEQPGALHAYMTLWPDTKAARETMAVIVDFIAARIEAAQPYSAKECH